MKLCFSVTSTAAGIKIKLNELENTTSWQKTLKWVRTGNVFHKGYLQNIGCYYKI